MLKRYIAFVMDISVSQALERRKRIPGGWDNVFGIPIPDSRDNPEEIERLIRVHRKNSTITQRVQIVDVHEGRIVKEFTLPT